LDWLAIDHGGQHLFEVSPRGGRSRDAECHLAVIDSPAVHH
jgi:hypothetical protein